MKVGKIACVYLTDNTATFRKRVRLADMPVNSASEVRRIVAPGISGYED